MWPISQKKSNVDFAIVANEGNFLDVFKYKLQVNMIEDKCNTYEKFSSLNISIMIIVFNEEERIEKVLESVIGFVTEIIVINKSSTDSTTSICKKFEPWVKLITVPYTERGADDFNLYIKFASSDWIFVLVASEIVEVGLFRLVNDYFEEYGRSSHDVVMIPRKYIAFGASIDHSPWGTLYFPFMFCSKTVVVTNVIHEHFTVREESRRYYIESKKYCHVLHKTHLSALSYMNSMLGYFKEEVKNINVDDINKNYLQKSYDQFLTYESSLRKSDDLSSIMHYAAWAIYWHGIILFACEKKIASQSNDSVNNSDYIPPLELIQKVGISRKINNFSGLKKTYFRSFLNIIRKYYRKFFQRITFFRRVVNFFK